jgi:cobyrinic acid a,c-diamide synthase
MAGESELPDDYLGRLGSLVHDHVDLNALVSRARPLQPATPDSGEFNAVGTGAEEARPAHSAPDVRVGVARDEAFCFYYPATLRELQRAGAEIVEFSPLAGEWPQNLDALYLGGGYPERFAAKLAEQREVLEGMAEFSAAGHPVWAECGGFMALCRALRDDEGVRHEMAGVFPIDIEMSDAPTIGYVDVEMASSAPWFAGQDWRGHAFHHSRIESELPDSIDRCFVARSPDGEDVAEGFVSDRTIGSYVHLHGAGNPGFVADFVDACR